MAPGRFLVAAALIPLAIAFSDTHPLVAWCSHRSSILDHLPSGADSSSVSLIESILHNDEVCEYDAIVLIEQPGVHASDLRTLPPSSMLARHLAMSPSARQFPYVRHAEFDAHSVAQTVSARCGSRFVSYVPGRELQKFPSELKHTFSVSFPSVVGLTGDLRKQHMHEHEDGELANELSNVLASFPNHLVIFTGSSTNDVIKRQSPDTARPGLEDALTYANSTLPEGGILKRYQLLTPALITMLLVTFLLLVPIVMIGFTALASIQSPLRVEAPKGYSAAEKKSQ